MADRWVDEPVRCLDPECPHPQPSAQPEADGDLRYYACPCGMEGGYEMARQEGVCAAGLPESMRPKFGVPSIAGRSINIPVPELTEEGRKVFLGSIGRRPS